MASRQYEYIVKELQFLESMRKDTGNDFKIDHDSQSPAGQTNPAAFITEETKASIATMDPLQISLIFIPRVSVFTDASHLSPPAFSPAEDPHQHSSQASAAVSVQDTSLDTCG